MELTQNICFRVDETLLEIILKLSSKMGLSKSAFCRMAIIDFINRRLQDGK